MSALVAAIPVTAHAADWKTSSGISLTHTYTDNTDLSDQNEKSDTALIATPRFSVTGKGNRANVDVDASLQFSDAGGQADNFNPNVNANADAELIEDFLFVDVDASARQTSIDPFAANGRSGVSNNENSTTTYQYGITPYISSRVKDYVTYELRYNFDDQVNDDRAVDDSNRSSASFDLSSGRYFGRVSWGLNTNYSRTEYEDRTGNVSATENSDNEFISSTLRLGYRLDRKWQINTSVGKEWNDFVSTDNDVDGNTWSAGVVWTANKRTTIDLGYGGRYFGNTPTLDIAYKHKRSELKLGYSRSATDSRGIRQLDSGVLAPVSNGSLRQFTSLTSRSNSTIIDERLELSYRLKGKRTSFSLDGTQSKQTREDTNVEDVFSSYSISIDRTLVGNASISFTYKWDEREDGDNSELINTDYYTLSLSRKVGKNTNLSVSYNLTDRDTEAQGDDYVENRVSVSVATSY